MQASRLAVSFGLLLTLGSSLALAAPGYEQSHHPPPRHAAPPPYTAVMPGWQQTAPERKPQHQAPHTGRQPAMQSGPPPRHQAHPGARAHQPPVKHARPAHQAPRPPADFRPVRAYRSTPTAITSATARRRCRMYISCAASRYRPAGGGA